MNPSHFKIGIAAPASIGNLAAGFDCLALALDLKNIFEMYVADRELGEGESEFASVSLDGHYAEHDETMKVTSSNKFIESFERTRKILCQERRLPVVKRPIYVHETVNIPPYRGLGGSASACVAGVLAALRFLDRIYPEESFEEVLKKQNDCVSLAMLSDSVSSPDNVCACLAGGLTYGFVFEKKRAITDDGPETVHHFCQEIHDDNLRVVALVPMDRVRTTDARQVIRDNVYTLEQVTFNIGRSTCIPEIFRTKRYELFAEAMKDSIHQDDRFNFFFPRGKLGRANLAAIFENVVGPDLAYGACIGGAGSTLVAFTDKSKVGKVGIAFRNAFRDAAPSGRKFPVNEPLELKPTNQGADYIESAADAALPEHIAQWLAKSAAPRDNLKKPDTPADKPASTPPGPKKTRFDDF